MSLNYIFTKIIADIPLLSEVLGMINQLVFLDSVMQLRKKVTTTNKEKLMQNSRFNEEVCDHFFLFTIKFFLLLDR